MPNLNQVALMGNMTRDPEVRYTPKGTAVGDIGMAVNRRTKVGEQWEDETTFVDVTLWGQQAEFAQKYLKKGSPVFVQGRLQMDTWEDKQSGQKRSKLKVVAESVQSLAKLEKAESGQQPRQASSPQARNEPGYGDEDDSDDIPF